MALEVMREISLEDIRQALSKPLGPRYTVTAASDSVIRVRRLPLVTANVHVKWHGDRTTLVVAPGEVWILQGINAFAIAPKVRRALVKAFPDELARAA